MNNSTEKDDLNRKVRVRTDAFIFRWAVNDAGYQWAKGIMDGKPHLVACFAPGKGAQLMEPPKGVFAEFAKLDPTEGKIREFADKYGDLFNSYEEKDLVRHEGIVGGGASLKRWRSEIADMRVLVDLWENIQKNRTSELQKVIRWQKTKDGNKWVSYVLKTPLRSHDRTLAHSALGKGLRVFNERDFVLPARYALQEEVNSRLAEHPTIPRLAWTPDTPEISGGYFERIVFTPPNLLAAMWLRFAQAITGELRLNQCDSCGKYYQVGPGGRRDDSTWCGNACKQANWNKEHEEELKLKREKARKSLR